MAAVNPIAITLGTAAIEITPSGQATQLIPKALITGVYPTRIQSIPSDPEEALSWKYPHSKIISVDIRMADDNNFRFDIQNVSNQAGWTADQSGQNQCITDIKTWLST